MSWKRDEPLTRDEVEKDVGTAGGFTIPTWRQRGGLVWILLLVVLLALVLSGGLPGGEDKVNLRDVLKPFPAVPAAGESLAGAGEPGFAAKVAADLQQTWRGLFRRAGVAFQPAKLVTLGRVAGARCGLEAPASADAFYCRFDARLLLDRRLGAAYPVAHAYAHHVQEILGITGQIARAEEESPRQAAELWRRHELQADCLAGVWARSALGDAEGAAAIDRAAVRVDQDIYLDRESWSAPGRAQRDRWFRRGLAGGKASACDTFTTSA